MVEEVAAWEHADLERFGGLRHHRPGVALVLPAEFSVQGAGLEQGFAVGRRGDQEARHGGRGRLGGGRRGQIGRARDLQRVVVAERRERDLQGQRRSILEMDDELFVGLQRDRGIQDPDRMDVGGRHLQRPATIDIGLFGAAVIARLAVRSVGEGHAHATFLAFGVGDGEANAEIRGGIDGQGIFREVDAYRGDRASRGVKTEGEVVTLAERLRDLHQAIGGEGRRFGCGRGRHLCLHLRLGGFGVLRGSLGALAGGGGRRGLEERGAGRADQAGGVPGKRRFDALLPGLVAGEGLRIGRESLGGLGVVRLELGAESGVLLGKVGVLHPGLGVERMVIADAFEFRFRRVVIVRVDAPLLHVGEEGLQGIEVRGLDRVELMVVTLRAAESAAQPGVGDRAHALGAVFGEVLLGLGAAFAGHHVQAIVAARGQLFFGRVRQQVAGELLSGEHVERLVAIERVDDVVAVGEDALVLVAVVADRVGEAGDIQPPDRHAFAEVRRGEQAVDLFFESIGRVVGDEGRGLGGSGRQPGEVEGETPEQAFLVRLGRQGRLLPGELGGDERIDRILAAGWHRRHDRGFERLIGPMGFVDGALGDPAAEEFLLGRRQRLVRFLLRHDVFGVVREDAFDDLALFRLARDDGDLAALAGLERFFAEIQAQAAFARLRVEAVAMEAGVRHDRTDVAVEADGVRRRISSEEADGEETGCGRQKAHKGCRYDTPDTDGFQSISRRIP